VGAHVVVGAEYRIRAAQEPWRNAQEAVESILYVAAVDAFGDHRTWVS
jgi:hypothetical protein